MRGVTYASINTSRTTINLHLINHLNNKRSTIGVLQIWSQSWRASKLTIVASRRTSSMSSHSQLSLLQQLSTSTVATPAHQPALPFLVDPHQYCSTWLPCSSRSPCCVATVQSPVVSSDVPRCRCLVAVGKLGLGIWLMGTRFGKSATHSVLQLLWAYWKYCKS
jgi:hypothetical protein